MVRFEWDPVKARTNRRKHGVSFEDAMDVFEDHPYSLFEQDAVDKWGRCAGVRSVWLEEWSCCSSPTPFGKRAWTK